MALLGLHTPRWAAKSPAGLWVWPTETCGLLKGLHVESGSLALTMGWPDKQRLRETQPQCQGQLDLEAGTWDPVRIRETFCLVVTSFPV